MLFQREKKFDRRETEERLGRIMKRERKEEQIEKARKHGKTEEEKKIER
jgi:hypothetical protein